MILHPAHELVAKVERAWSDNDKQASERARQVVVMLHQAGIIKGELKNGLVHRDG